jgi:outer membrane protein TolC
VNVFFDYKLALLSLKLVRNQLDDASKLHKLVQNKAQNAVASEIDVARSDLQYLLHKVELETTEEQSENYRKSIFNLTNTNYAPTLALKKIDTAKVLQLVKNSDKKPADRQLEMLNLQIEQATSQATLADKSSSPDLAVFIGGQKDNSTRFQSETQKTEFIVGLDLTLAIGEDSAKQSLYQKAVFDKSQLDLKKSLHIAQRKDEIAKASEKITRQISLMSLANKRLKNAKMIVSGEETRHRSGRIDLEKLISARDLEKDAELYSLKQDIALRKALVAWFAATDQLVENGAIVKLWSVLE